MKKKKKCYVHNILLQILSSKLLLMAKIFFSGSGFKLKSVTT